MKYDPTDSEFSPSSSSYSLANISLLNRAAHMRMGVGPSSAAWGTY